MTNQQPWIHRLRGALRIPALLVAVYLASTALHLYLLRNAFQFPHIASDEVQFAMTGENIRLGHGYTLRGQFNSTLPPVFPLFIALAHSAGADPRTAMFVLSCFVMCSALFPIYALGKAIGLDTATAAILGAAASLLPHTLYAATYMSEIVQYPAYLTAFYLAFRWFDHRSWSRDAVMGCAIGFLLLTKVQGSQFAGAFLIAGVIVAFRSRQWSAGSPTRFVAHFGTVLITTAALEGAWNIYKSTHAGTALGAYGRILAEQGLPYWTPRLTVAYFADFLLAPGLITAVLLFYWIRHNGNYPRTLFVLAVLGVQLIAVSTLDGGLTGWLRERLFLYALPITAVLSAKGLEYFKERQTVFAQFAFVAVPVLLIGAVMAYPFQVSSIIEIPWANALGSLAGLLPFSRSCLIAATVALILAVAFILLRSSSSAPLLLGEFLLLFYGAGFASSSVALGAWTAQGLRSISPIMGWLAANHVRGGDRLLVTGRHSYFEDPALRAAPLDGMLLRWTWRTGFDEAVEWQIETIGRFDVRMIPTAKAIQDEGHPGDYLLTVARFDAFSPVSSLDSLQLYRIHHALPQTPSPKFVVHISAPQFHPEKGWSAYTSRLGFEHGMYQIGLNVTNASPDLAVEVTEGEGKILARKTAALALTSVSFAHHSDGPLTFRVFGNTGNGFHFDGIDLQWVSDSEQAATRYVADFVPNGAFLEAEPSDLLRMRSANGATCYVDILDNALSTDQRRGAQIFGWAVETNENSVAEQIYLELFSPTGLHYWAKAHQYSRPDVAKASGKPALSGSGSALSADSQSVAPGVYRLKIVLVNRGYARECDPMRSLDIR